MDKSGIYKIINLVNGNLYVGSAKNLNIRKKSHFYSLRNNKPSFGNYFLTGRYGSKSHFSNPAALKQRKKAGKLRIAALSTGVLGIAISEIGRQNPASAAGAALVGSLLGATSVGLTIGAVKNASGAANQQTLSNEKK